MMRCVSVCVRGEWVRVPLGGASTSVCSLGKDALQRYQQVKGHENGERSVRFSMQRCRGGEILHLDDKVDDVLEDNDFVHMGTLLWHVCLDVQISGSLFPEYSEMLFVCFFKVFTGEKGGCSSSPLSTVVYPSVD